MDKQKENLWNIEQLNRTCRKGLLNLYTFRNLKELKEATYWWQIDYNEHRSHNSLDSGLYPGKMDFDN